jgi:hypothetical protein
MLGIALQQLISPRRRVAAAGERRTLRRRRMLATGYQRVLDEALRPQRGLSVQVAVQREQVLDAAADIERLVARLREPDRRVNEEGLTLARTLLCDGDGPLFVWAEPGTLRRRIRVILEAME